MGLLELGLIGPSAVQIESVDRIMRRRLYARFATRVSSNEQGDHSLREVQAEADDAGGHDNFLKEFIRWPSVAPRNRGGWLLSLQQCRAMMELPPATVSACRPA